MKECDFSVVEEIVDQLITKYPLILYSAPCYRFKDFLIEVIDENRVLVKIKLDTRFSDVADIVQTLHPFWENVRFSEWRIYRGGKSDMWFTGIDAEIEKAADTLINNLGVDQSVGLIEDFDLRDKSYGLCECRAFPN